MDDPKCLVYFLLYTLSGDGAQMLGTIEWDGKFRLCEYMNNLTCDQELGVKAFVNSVVYFIDSSHNLDDNSEPDFP